MELELHKNYTIAELQATLGSGWTEVLSGYHISQVVNKPVIFSFNDFDQNTKTIYTKVLNILKSYNPKQEIKLYAVGSRIQGNWFTKQEAEEAYESKNLPVKYSDYDAYTTAQTVPDQQFFANNITELSGSQIDFGVISEDERMVEIPNN
jgi:hypothetical protein